MRLLFGIQTKIGYSFPVILMLLLSHISFAQPGCAGTDGTITICNYSDPDTQTIDLFTLLGGSPAPGGTWVDPIQTGALNTQTGILDVWDIHNSGIYVFTYLVNSGSCTDTSTVTVTIGGYSGIGNATNAACSNDNSVNLFQFFVNDLPNPHQNGVWTNDSNGQIVSSTFNAQAAGVGTYNFTYTMPAVGSCPAMSTSIAVTVYRSPVSGSRIDILLCNTDDFSTLTNVNLFDHLVGEDPNGQWTETITNELAGPFDSLINVQNIFNTLGIGTYSFSYTVYPPHPVCTPRTTIVRIFIEQFLDFSASTLTVNSNICESQIPTATYSAIISPAAVPIPAGVYNISYQITGPQPTVNFTQNASYNNGFTFPVNASFFPTVGAYTMTITGIKKNSDLGACDNLINASDVIQVYPDPDITNATVVFSPMCRNVDGQVDLSGNTNLGSGTYAITYNLSGSNTATNQSVTINAVGGLATFTIPAALLQNLGNTTISFLSIVNTVTGCSKVIDLDEDFTVNGNTVTTLAVTAGSACTNNDAMISVAGLGTMASVTITYNLSGANTATNQTITVPVTLGNASAQIPAALLQNAGITTFTITQITDSVTLCNAAVNAPGSSFTVAAKPAAPAAADSVFCAGDDATVADLRPLGNQYLWYNSATATTPLPLDGLLVPGQYFVSEVQNQCESDRTEISVTIVSLDQLILVPGGDDFCGADDPTLQDLSDNVQADNVILWYDAAVGGSLLPNTTPLQDNATYYGVNALPGSPCASPVLAIRVSLDECEDPDYNLFIPDGFSPNGDTVNDVFRIPNIEHIFPEFKLEIYNRYGSLMFRADKNNPAWDGRDSDTDNLIDGIAANGVYFYVLHYNKDNASPRQGQLYLNR